jgi:asparagine synthase (glutamine-hydrolysing)
MLGGMRGRGCECSAVWSRDSAALGVARNTWECAPAFSGAVMVGCDGELAIAADASLYYRADLVRRIAGAGVRPCGDTASHLILSAYRAWGPACLPYLEGDYAFVLWDHAAQRVFCARDCAGSRPLFFTEIGGTLLVASSLGALRAHPSCPGGLNHAVLAETAANVWQSPGETPYAALTAVPAGYTLSWRGPGTAHLVRQWSPPPITTRGAASFSDAAAELRHRLTRAVAERLGADVTSVWMSGGRDSTAVFAAGQATSRQLRPVSVSFPPGDAGREDETIGAVAERWQTPVHWLDSRRIPVFEHPEHGAARRDEPYEPLYEVFNRALARGSRAVGARVALDGWGGDQLFTRTPVYLADLVRTGRWVALAREWRALGVRDWRFFARTALVPLVPPPARAAAAMVRGGRPLPGPLDGWIPGWLTAPWKRAVADRQRDHVPPRAGRSFEEHELHFFLTCPTVSRVRGWLSALALEEGIETRSPLYDVRVIELAVSRPGDERRTGRETKLLLRAAMQGLLPDAVLAPRRVRTGVMSDYLRGAMTRDFLPLLDDVLHDPVVLAELGIIEPAALRRAAELCINHTWDEQVAVALLFTLHTELWLRGHVQQSAGILEFTDTSDDGHSLAVLSPGERPGFIHHGGAACTSNRSSSASEPSGSSP